MNIKIETLTKKYGEKVVVAIEKAIIPSGKIIAIVGANGSGKTTLMKIIGGIEKPTSGQVRYDENEEIPYKKMTLVFQKPYLLSTTVEKNIEYPLRLRGIEKEKRGKRVNELIEMLGLEETRKRQTYKLSGGETQKVALGRALSFSPKVLLLDEPTANIDPKAINEIESILLKINREEKTTIVIVTHNLMQAKRLGDIILFMDKGNLQELDGNDKTLEKISW